MTSSREPFVFFLERVRAHRWRGGALAIALVSAVVMAAALTPRDAVLVADRTVVRADGRSMVHVTGVYRSWLGSVAPRTRPRVVVDEALAAQLGVEILFDHRGDLFVRAGVKSGSLEFHDDEYRSRLVVHFEVDLRDLDGDGFPDAAECMSHDDRRAFTSWFTAIAEMQAVAIDDDWARVHQDCAGLVRFAAKEALRAHDDTWRQARRSRVLTRAPDVMVPHYPHLPLIGDKLWRVRAGAFDPGAPLDDQFSASANARTLLHHNTVLVSRDVRDARAGDLLFFHVPDANGSRMHTMIALATPAGGTLDDQATRVVYHTGGDGERGVVRLVTLDALLQHPDAGWRPLVDNPRFIGVHRLHHVTHDRERISPSTASGGLLQRPSAPHALALGMSRSQEAP
jgi:uncharacterized protein YfaT (DUF1175 family)